MTKPVAVLACLVLGDEVARRLGLRVEAVCYGRRGPASGLPGRCGPGRVVKAVRWCRVGSDHRDRSGRG